MCGGEEGDIIKLYNEAKECYEKMWAEKVELENRRKIKGELLLTLSDAEGTSDSAQTLEVFIRPDKSVYCVFNDGLRHEDAPTIQVKKAGAVLATYHPSQAIYTSVTVGGVTTGGVHYTKEGYSYSKDNNGKGEITVKANTREFIVKQVTMSEYTYKRFRRDTQYKSLVTYRSILCYKNTKNQILMSAVQILQQVQAILHWR